MKRITYCGESFPTTHEGADTTDAVAYLRDRALLQARPGEYYCADCAAAAMEYGWDDIEAL